MLIAQIRSKIGAFRSENGPNFSNLAGAKAPELGSPRLVGATRIALGLRGPRGSYQARPTQRPRRTRALIAQIRSKTGAFRGENRPNSHNLAKPKAPDADSPRFVATVHAS